MGLYVLKMWSHLVLFLKGNQTSLTDMKILEVEALAGSVACARVSLGEQEAPVPHCITLSLGLRGQDTRLLGTRTSYIHSM